MRRSLVVSLFLVLSSILFLLIGLGWTSLERLGQRYLAARSPSQPFRTEEQWLTEQIVRDLAEIIFVAKNGANSKISELKVQSSPQSDHTFKISIDSAGSCSEQKLTLKNYLWAHESYTDLVSALLSTWKVPVGTATKDDGVELLDQLSRGDMAELIRASKKVSESLTRTPLDATLHEKAALIVGCLALREAAGAFSDTRPALNRITAHLALARTLQPQASNCGKVAEIIQFALVGRQAEAFTKIGALPESLERWTRILQMRSMGDWRVLAEPTRASRLEQFEYFRALRERGFCPKSRAFLSQIHSASEPEWTRIAMEENLSVQEGHAFTNAGVPWEIKSTVDDWQAFSGDTLSESQFAEVLNRPATSCVNRELDGKVQLEVLNWGMLAAFHQRHLCHALVKTEHFLQHTWGVPEEAKRFRASMEKSFARITLFPIVRSFFELTDRAKEIALESATALSHEHPELITAESWSALGPLPHNGAERALPREASAWFGDFPISGTSYDFRARYYRTPKAKNLATLTQMVMLAPFNHDVIQANVHERFNGHENGEQVAFAYMAIKDFDLRAMWLIAEGYKDQPETYGKMLEPICALHPDYFLILGQYYVDKKMPAEAASAYQNAFERAEDRVYMANSSRWIVDYYFDHGRTDDALKIAKDAAEVYSHSGLCTMGHLMERMKRYPEAEEYYKKVQKRYDDSAVLNAFYIRNRDQVPEYGRLSEHLKASTFPKGIENTQLGDFNGLPRDGVSIASTNTLVAGARLKAGDVIVAINNVRVHSQKQYIYVRDMDPDPNMTLIVWNGAQYFERKVNLPQRRFYCDLADFKAH